MRYGLVKLISEEKMTIRDAAKRMNINYENAKAIYRTFRMQKRIVKIKYRRSREYADFDMFLPPGMFPQQQFSPNCLTQEGFNPYNNTPHMNSIMTTNSNAWNSLYPTQPVNGIVPYVQPG